MADSGKKTPGPKGCATCTKRRIKCDLSVPSCTKCVGRDLVCPGYGRRIRWANAVAVRGKWKGQSTPVLPDPVHGLDAKLSKCAVDSVSSRMPQSLEIPSTAFLDYYDKNLAGLMVWIDSEDNDYRRRVLPLAQSTPGLRYAVAAISAHHGSALFSHGMTSFPEAARDACLSIVQTRVQEMTGRLTGGYELNDSTDITDAEWMLASILMISCYEMSNSQAAAAEGHRMAARRIVNIFGAHMEEHKRGLFAFLRNQLAIYDILASTTSFDLADVQKAILPVQRAENTLFSDYLHTLHEMTLLSRQAEGSSSERGFPTARSIRSRFSQARGSTLMAAGKLRVESQAVSRDLVRLVEIYHHAAILYSYRSLGYATVEVSDRISSTSKLFEQLLELEDPKLVVQNLAWPVFVAGTECHGDAQQQQCVADLLTSYSEIMGFKNYIDVLAFLKAFWGGSEENWQPLAKDSQARGFRIVAV